MTAFAAPSISLTVRGRSALGVPLPDSGYARGAYGNVAVDFGPATWLTIDAAGCVSIFVGKVEYGQGIRWGLAMAAAEELCLDPSAIRVVLGDTGTTPWDIGTFGSQSTRLSGVQVRRAAATARECLLGLAGERLDLPPEQLAVADGRIFSSADPARGLSFAELLAGLDLQLEIPRGVPRHSPAEFAVMGSERPRGDVVDRVTGRTEYARDIIRPGMLFARVLRPPSFGARLARVDAELAERMPGVVTVVREGDLVAVLAETDQQADAAHAMVNATWDEAPSGPSQWDLPALLAAEPRDPVSIQEAGDVEAALRTSAHSLEATYFVPYVTAAPMEPRAAVAEWEGGRLTLWAGTQRPFGLRSEVAAALSIDESLVRVHAPDIGGAFGAKSIYRVALEAARLARLAGRPVRVAYTRAEEFTWSTFRPAALITIRSGFTADGRITAWDYHVITTTTDRPMIGQRGSESPYLSAAPAVRVVASAGPAPLEPGSYRSLGCAVNHFAREVHIDEIATVMGIDSVELRLKNLAEPRLRKVLETAADDFGWGTIALSSPGFGAGVALGVDVGSYIAECAAVRVRGHDVQVERVSAALDCGLVFNPDGVRAQVEGAIVQGLGPTLWESAEFESGRLLNASFARYRVPRITQSPDVSVSLVGAAENDPTGAGEPGIVPIAPAVANALFAATGRRLRELPLQRRLSSP